MKKFLLLLLVSCLFLFTAACGGTEGREAERIHKEMERLRRIASPETGV